MKLLELNKLLKEQMPDKEKIRRIISNSLGKTNLTDEQIVELSYNWDGLKKNIPYAAHLFKRMIDFEKEEEETKQKRSDAKGEIPSWMVSPESKNDMSQYITEVLKLVLKKLKGKKG